MDITGLGAMARGGALRPCDPADTVPLLLSLSRFQGVIDTSKRAEPQQEG